MNLIFPFCLRLHLIQCSIQFCYLAQSSKQLSISDKGVQINSKFQFCAVNRKNFRNVSCNIFTYSKHPIFVGNIKINKALSFYGEIYYRNYKILLSIYICK